MRQWSAIHSNEPDAVLYSAYLCEDIRHRYKVPGGLKALPEPRFLLPQYAYLLKRGFQRDGLAVRELEVPEYPRVAAVEHGVKLSLRGIRHRCDLHLDRLAGVASALPALRKLENLHSVVNVLVDRDIQKLLVRRDVDNIEPAPRHEMQEIQLRLRDIPVIQHHRNIRILHGVLPRLGAAGGNSRLFCQYTNYVGERMIYVSGQKNS